MRMKKNQFQWIILVFLCLAATNSVLAGNDLPQSRTFVVNKVYAYPGTAGYGNDVLLLIEKFPMDISSSALARINMNLNTNPPGMPLCYTLQPDPSGSGCPPLQEKVNGICYPMECANNPTKEFSAQLLNENGNSWDFALYTRTSNQVPAGDYQITGTVSITFQALLKRPGDIVPLTPKITITNPKELDIWRKGQTHNITWDRVGHMHASVKIELLNSRRQFVRWVISNTSNDGSHPWSIPANVSDGNYIIRIKTLDDAVQGESKAFRIMQ
jgi:hypothetical protein